MRYWRFVLSGPLYVLNRLPSAANVGLSQVRGAGRFMRSYQDSAASDCEIFER